MRFGGNPFGQRLSQPRFAHTWLSRDQYHLAVAGLDLRPVAQQQFDLLLTPDQRREARAQRLELPERAVLRDHLPSWHWLRQPLQRHRAEVPTVEQAADLA